MLDTLKPTASLGPITNSRLSVTSPSLPTPSTNVDRPPEPPLTFFFFSSSYFSFSYSIASTSSAVASAVPIHTTHNPCTPTNTTTVKTSDVDPIYTSPHCDRTSTSHIGLAGHLRIHRTETGEPMPRALTYTRRIRLHCPHFIRTFIHRMGLLGHMCVNVILR
nr:unnamed protein product [Spirometra erinaceieuropaei]